MHLRPHGIRHTAITQAIDLAGKNGLSTDVIRHFSRHRSLAMLMVYRDVETVTDDLMLTRSRLLLDVVRCRYAFLSTLGCLFRHVVVRLRDPYFLAGEDANHSRRYAAYFRIASNRVFAPRSPRKLLDCFTDGRRLDFHDGDLTRCRARVDRFRRRFPGSLIERLRTFSRQPAIDMEVTCTDGNAWRNAGGLEMTSHKPQRRGPCPRS